MRFRPGGDRDGVEGWVVPDPDRGWDRAARVGGDPRDRPQPDQDGRLPTGEGQLPGRATPGPPAGPQGRRLPVLRQRVLFDLAHNRSPRAIAGRLAAEAADPGLGWSGQPRRGRVGRCPTKRSTPPSTPCPRASWPGTASCWTPGAPDVNHKRRTRARDLPSWAWSASRTARRGRRPSGPRALGRRPHHRPGRPDRGRDPGRTHHPVHRDPGPTPGTRIAVRR